MKLFQLTLCSIAVFVLFTCGEKKSLKETITLKDVYKDNFYTGVAIGGTHITGNDTLGVKLIETQFNSITAENIMKWMHIHPIPETFNFELPDKFVEFGQKNNMFIVGHTLLWHSQLANYVKEIKDSTSLADHIKIHINTIVGRYRGKVNGWDVLNEALNEDGTLRETIFYEILGEEYLKVAFMEAAKTDPDAELYYNDYNLCQPKKRNGAIDLLKRLQAQGMKVDGVGIQAHWGLVYPSLKEIEKSILAYSELGLKVMFTELDITVLPNPWNLEGAGVEQNFENNKHMNPYAEGLPDTIQVEFNKRYEDIFKLFLKHEDKISRITFWGVNDAQSWLNNWPIRGRTNYPLLFDREYFPKKAFFNIIGLKQEQLQ